MTRAAYPTIGIVQGESWTSPTFIFPGDLSDWEPRGQIRSKLLEKSGTLLAEFTFETLTYDAEADETSVTATLTPAQTSALKITRYQGSGELSKSNVYYYDIELESADGVVVKLAPGAVFVVGEVTGPGVPVGNLELFLTAGNNLSELEDPEEARANLGIGDPGDYATHTQGQLAESALQPEDIGVTIQPFNVGTIVDLLYNTFTGAEKSKLAGIQSGAQVNPDLSGYAPIASPIITGFPQLPNNTRINGVGHFYQTTKPVTRGDGSALVVGDRWWKTDEGTEWFWNGTYWLSNTVYSLVSGNASGTTASTSYINLRLTESRIATPIAFVTRVIHRFLMSGAFDASNYYIVRTGFSDAFPVFNFGIYVDECNLWTDSVLVTTNSSRRHSVRNVAYYLDTVTPGSLGVAGLCSLAMAYRAVGTPGALSILNTTVEYREAI